MAEMDAILREQNIKLAQEIVERNQAEENLKNRNAFIETILNNLPIGLAVNKITDGKTIYLNDKFEEIYGWPRNAFSDVDNFFLHVMPDPTQRKARKRNNNVRYCQWRSVKDALG